MKPHQVTLAVLMSDCILRGMPYGPRLKRNWLTLNKVFFEGLGHHITDHKPMLSKTRLVDYSWGREVSLCAEGAKDYKGRTTRDGARAKVTLAPRAGASVGADVKDMDYISLLMLRLMHVY